MTVLVGSIAGGAGGAIAAGILAAKVAGTVGTTVAPGVGTVIGITGGFVGGVVGSKAVDVVGDVFREDDVVILGRLFNAIVSCMIGEYLLDSDEMDLLMKEMNEITSKEFKGVFTSMLKEDKQEKVVRDFLAPRFDKIVEARDKFTLPSADVIIESLVEEC